MLTVLAGVPGAGKSTYANAMFDRAQIASYDAMADMLQGCDSESADHSTTYHLEAERLVKTLACARLHLGGSVCVDATNLHYYERHYWRNLARDADCEAHLVMFDTPLWLALCRNGGSEAPLDENTVRRIHRRATKMFKTADAEGFTTIAVVKAHPDQEDLDPGSCIGCGGDLMVRAESAASSGFAFACAHCEPVYPVMEPRAEYPVLYGGKQ